MNLLIVDRYTLQIAIAQNGVARSPLMFNEAGGSQQSPASPATPDVVASVVTASVPGEVYRSFGTVYLLKDPRLG